MADNTVAHKYKYNTPTLIQDSDSTIKPETQNGNDTLVTSFLRTSKNNLGKNKKQVNFNFYLALIN